MCYRPCTLCSSHYIPIIEASMLDSKHVVVTYVIAMAVGLAKPMNSKCHGWVGCGWQGQRGWGLLQW